MKDGEKDCHCKKGCAFSEKHFCAIDNSANITVVEIPTNLRKCHILLSFEIVRNDCTLIMLLFFSGHSDWTPSSGRVCWNDIYPGCCIHFAIDSQCRPNFQSHYNSQSAKFHGAATDWGDSLLSFVFRLILARIWLSVPQLRYCILCAKSYVTKWSPAILVCKLKLFIALILYGHLNFINSSHRNLNPLIG